MILDLDAETRMAISSMVYDRWCKAFEAWKSAKELTWESSGKFCPKDDWKDYHASMITAAAAEWKLAEKLKRDICPFSPLVTGV